MVACLVAAARAPLRAGPLWRRRAGLRGRLAWLALPVLMLPGCGGTPPAAPATAAAPAASPPTPVDPTAAFEVRQRELAESAMRQGRFADALWTWDVLLTLHPGHEAYSARRAQALSLRDALLADRLARADAARQRGDADAAVAQYLGALALAPDHAGAADALRALERERVQRQHLGKLSRLTLARGVSAARPPARADTRTGTAKAAAAGSRNGTDRNVVEHAAMLAAQGETGDAIALLQAHLARHRDDAAARKMLADLQARHPGSEGERSAQPADAASSSR